MSIESPIFDNIYIAAGVMGLLVLLLIVLLVYGRRRRSAGSRKTGSQKRETPDGKGAATADETLSPAVGTAVAASGGPGTSSEAGRSPGGIQAGGAAMNPPPPSTGEEVGPDRQAVSGDPPVAPAIAPGDPVAKVIMAMAEDSGDLTDSELRRLELFRPAKVIAVADSLAGGLSGRGNEMKRLRLQRIRQYAVSLQAQIAAAGMSPKPAPEPGPSAPPPGSGTEVSGPEAWGVAERTTEPLPLDRELSFNSASSDGPAPPASPEPTVESPETVPSAEIETAPPARQSDGVDARQWVLSAATTDDSLPTKMPPNGGPPPSSEAGLWATTAEPDVSPEPPVFAGWEPSQQKVPLAPPSRQPTSAETEPPVPSPPLYRPDDPPGAPIAEELVESMNPSRESPDLSHEGAEPDTWEKPAVVKRDAPEMLDSSSPEELGRVLREPADRATKLAVLGALEGMGTARALAAVEGALEDPDPEVLRRALDAAERLLAQLGGPPV